MLSTLFMGTPEIAVPALRLLAARTRVRAVVTQPDRPAGRGNQLTPPAVKIAALELGLPIWQPETLKGQAADARFDDLDLTVVMAYGELLRQEVLDRPRHGCINLHASLLPRWRGASPMQAVIRAGEATTGVCVMRMVRGLDAGPVYLREEVPLSSSVTLPWLHDRLAQAAADALGRFLDAWPQVTATPQDDHAATHCRKLTAEDGQLIFTRTAAELDRWVRAYTPAPGCWVPMAGGRLRILALQPWPASLPVGDMVAVDGRILVGCSDGAVAISRLQSPGKKALDAAAWLNGNKLPTGQGPSSPNPGTAGF